MIVFVSNGMHFNPPKKCVYAGIAYTCIYINWMFVSCYMLLDYCIFMAADCDECGHFFVSEMKLQRRQAPSYQASSAFSAHSSTMDNYPILVSHSDFNPDSKDLVQCPHCQVIISSLAMKQHIAHYHSGVMPVRCLQCGKGFFSVSGLKHHVLIHKGMKFRCPICDTTFTQKSKVKRHLKNVHGSLPCVSCSGIFQIGSDYDQHVLNCHEPLQ